MKHSGDLNWFWNGFEEIADAPNGVLKLRALVLQLAVQGRLVPQDASDEPASALLERISAEKARLVTEGKIRKSAPLAPVAEDEAPFDLPESWAWVRLGEVVEYDAGNNCDPNNVPADAWLLELEDIEKNTSRIIQRVAFVERNSTSAKNRFLKDDVLYGKLRPYLNKVVVADSEGFSTTEIVSLRGYLEVSPHYLKYYLRSPSFTTYIAEKTYGTKMPRLGTQDARCAAFPLPPLAEQKRIVAKVDELMALCDELDSVQKQKRAGCVLALEANLDHLTRARDADEFASCLESLADHFDELLAAPENVAPLRAAILSLAVQGKLVAQDPDDEPAPSLNHSLFYSPTDDQPSITTWKTMSIEEACSHIVDCLHSTPVFTKEGFLCIDTTCISPGKIHYNRARYVTDESFKDRTRRLLPVEGDILFSREGTVGTAVRVPSATQLCLGQRMMMYRPQEFVDSEYFLQFLMSPPFQVQLYAKMTGTASKHVNIGEIRKMWVAVPPLAEQKRIVARVDELMALCDELEVGLRAHESDGAALVEATVRAIGRG